MSYTSTIRTGAFMHLATSLVWNSNTFHWKNKNSFDEIMKVLYQRILHYCPDIIESFPEFSLLDLNRLVRSNFDEHNTQKDSKQIIFCAFNTEKAGHNVISKDQKRLKVLFALLDWALDGVATISGYYTVRGQVIEAKLVLV